MIGLTGKTADPLGAKVSAALAVDRPRHFGESRPHLPEEDAITSAMSRRVEMFVIKAGAW